MKQKSKKKWFIIIAAAVVLIAGAAVGIISLRNHNISVYVQPVEYINESWILYESTLQGVITESAVQREYLRTDADVEEVFVKEGDHVKKGDELFRYDTASVELDISEKELSVAICENELQKQKNLLAEYEAIVPVTVKPEEPKTVDEPMDAPDSSDADGEGGDIIDDTDSENVIEPEEPAETFTAAEKEALVRKQKLEISKLENDLGVAETNLAKAKTELDKAIVKAAVTGKVTAIGKKDGASASDPFCVVTGEGGVKLEGYISEFELDTTVPGDMIEVSSWMSGSFTEAEIQEIDSYPAENRYFYREGNQNTSYYRFIAYMDDASGFEIGEEVEIRKAGSSSDMDAIVLPKVYTKSDDGGVYVMIDDEGRLKKQYVSAERAPDASYLIISEGLTLEARIAFPGGSGLKEGTKTTDEYSFELF